MTVSAQLSGLTPGTTYHFDLVATNGRGSVSSGGVPFTAAAAGATTTSAPTGSAKPKPTTSASWRLGRQSVANRPGWFDGLSAVSCASTSFCFATGFAEHGATGDPLIERWTGRSWTIVFSPAASEASLLGVSCASPANCAAVGRDGLNTYSEHWNGSSWSVVSAPSPSQSELSGVDCPSSANCWAVGASGAFGNHASPLAEHWDGRGWSVASTPRAPVELQFISCRSLTMCWAAGNLGMLRLVGGAWRTVAAPGAEFVGISCASVHDCWVIGDGGSNQWNGRTWSQVASPRVPVLSPRFPPALFGVACPTTSECVAVGVINEQAIGPQRAIAEVTRPA